MHRIGPREAVPLPDRGPRLCLAEGLGAAELHSHTLASDGMVSADDLVRAASAIGLSVLCITDHDRLGATQRSIELGREMGVDVVVGEEITTRMPPGVHIIGLFLRRPVRMGMTVADTVDAIHDEGGLAILPHPFMPTYFASIGSRQARDLLEHRQVDGIELRHTAVVLPGTWGRLDAFYREYRERLGAAIGAGDSHFGAADLGRVVTLFPGRSAADLRRALEARTTSPYRGIEPSGPRLSKRVLQQYRALLWLGAERRAGRVGVGVGPRVVRER